ncbi:MAG: ABC transporter ATP-binding protein [Alphaproteobacteria bacterium]|jgi:lipoprotein-releasing system ATP-binding protein lolD 1|nr:MAG: ABC transporter [Azospirillum sp. 51_20]
MNNEKETVLELKQICKSFRQGSQKLDVLTGVDLEIKSGEIVALIGPSGSGKSTLLQIAGLLETPSSGEIYLNRQNCSKLGDGLRTLLRRDFLGFVYQYHNLLPDFSAEENVMLPQLIAGRKAKAARERAAWLLERLNLGSRLKHRPAEMSGGEQQRVAIARALANAPKLLLADEPTGNLDPKTSDVVFAELLNIVKETGLSALIATHNMELASAMDRKVRLEDGRLVNTGISGLISGENFY